MAAQAIAYGRDVVHSGPLYDRMAVEGDAIVVSSPDVDAPVAVRYAFADDPVCSLGNRAGLWYGGRPPTTRTDRAVKYWPYWPSQMSGDRPERALLLRFS